MSNTQLLNQYGLTFFTVKDVDFGVGYCSKSNTYPLLSQVLNFNRHVDMVEDIEWEIDNVISENSYEDISAVYIHIRILPNEIRIYDKDNDNYNQPNIILSTNDFKAILHEWKTFLINNPY